jgi:DNA repair protein RecO (recombination protein O)
VDGMARGTQRITSKLAGSLEPLLIIKLSIAHGPRNDQVIGAVVEKRFRTLTESLPRFGAAHSITELLDQLVKPYHPDERIFTLVEKALERLENPQPIFRGFVDLVHLQLLAALGYEAAFVQSVVSGRDADDGVFDPSHGGFVLAEEASISDLPRITRQERGTLEALLASDEPPASDPGFAPELYRALRTFIYSKLDHPLRSDAFLTSVLQSEA